MTELRRHPAADRVEIAGSARRMTDTCKDLDVIATAHDAAALTEAFGSLEVIDEVRSSGEAGARGVTHNGLAVDFRVVAPEQFGNVLQHLTGSKQHNVALREYAVRRGLHVSEYGVEDDATGEQHTCATEQDVYALLGLDYIEPELRENRGELQGRAVARAARAGHRGPTAGRPALPHHPLRRARHARADGRGGAGTRATPTWP